MLGVPGMPRIIIAVTGMPGSGKSLIAEEIAAWFGYRVYKMGDVVRGEVRRRGLPLTVENVERVATELRRLYGKGAVARLLLEHLENDPGEGVVVDGMRSMEEARILSGSGNSRCPRLPRHPSTAAPRREEEARRCLHQGGAGAEGPEEPRVRDRRGHRSSRLYDRQ